VETERSGVDPIHSQHASALFRTWARGLLHLVKLTGTYKNLEMARKCRRLGVKTEAKREFPTGNPSPAPIAARTTRQINGALNFCGWSEFRWMFLLTSRVQKFRPEL
jgi:2-hydroxychromene-2-carboxylate isomerase